MDTVFLETFVTVIDTGSLAEAARILGLTPPAVAQRIKALEKEIGDALLQRNGRAVRPTASGLAILGKAHSLIREARDLRAIAVSKGGGGPVELRLGATATALTGQLPDAVSNIRKIFPKVELYVQPGSSLELYPRVVSGDLDAAIIVQPQFPILKSCGWQTLRREPLVLLVPESLDVSDPHQVITSEPFIRYDRKHWGGQIVDRFLQANNLQVTTFVEMDALDAIATFVGRGLGVAILPDWAPPWPEKLSIKKIPLTASTEVRNVGVLWWRASPRIAVVRAFLSACKSLR
ncbi:LysR family transcriptional regulator [Propionivibrio dicarboxylicus]|uniref:DNA-binding transcriptional regulator, LysR family n=1 Tax=Propionivibrio dicarboxylicus TaxID=83767 RepID=A0A1G7Z4Q1_9RHOO|nr:LysR family transcriptional regulator [Propionivibrio dicarboxylicus]SDH03120.1 DNA-binding transcriptional regulator, LysR family [Propionivibrio dicarboxylicus]